MKQNVRFFASRSSSLSACALPATTANAIAVMMSFVFMMLSQSYHSVNFLIRAKCRSEGLRERLLLAGPASRWGDPTPGTDECNGAGGQMPAGEIHFTVEERTGLREERLDRELAYANVLQAGTGNDA